MTEDYRCKHCGTIVIVQAIQVNVDDAGTKRGFYNAWCRCAQTSPTDKNHRGMGEGDTPEAAVAAWRNWTPKDGRSN